VKGHAAQVEVAADTQTPARQRLASLRGFLRTEAGGAIVLLLATVAALAWANSPWVAGYDALWGTELSLIVGDLVLSHDLRGWVNDGLMTVFFLLIGLEVRREFDLGEFRQRRRIAAPVLAAIGGMLLPVIIFLDQPGRGGVARLGHGHGDGHGVRRWRPGPRRASQPVPPPHVPAHTGHRRRHRGRDHHRGRL
jgi:hypothetical protein